MSVSGLVATLDLAPRGRLAHSGFPPQSQPVTPDLVRMVERYLSFFSRFAVMRNSCLVPIITTSHLILIIFILNDNMLYLHTSIYFHLVRRNDHLA